MSGGRIGANRKQEKIMTKANKLVTALEAAIEANTADVPGTWSVNTGEDYTRCSA
jgi:hypothetical protein